MLFRSRARSPVIPKMTSPQGGEILGRRRSCGSRRSTVGVGTGFLSGHSYFVEVQLRTIAMDSWASLEHQMKYKHEIKDTKRIVRELKRCADELASCDVTMQTIRNLIRESE